MASGVLPCRSLIPSDIVDVMEDSDTRNEHGEKSDGGQESSQVYSSASFLGALWGESFWRRKLTPRIIVIFKWLEKSENVLPAFQFV